MHAMNRLPIILTLAVSCLACAEELNDTTPQRLFFDAGDTGALDASTQRQDQRVSSFDAMVATDTSIDRDVSLLPDAATPPPPMMDAALPPDPQVNAGWIGGPCARDGDCMYDDGFCLQEAEGYPRGLCSVDCDRFCPDRDGMPVTFCISGITANGGACVQRCDYEAFGGSGCRPGYHCETRERFNESTVGRGVCVPGEERFEMMSACFDELDQRGVNYDQVAPIEDVPADAPHLRCRVVEPLLLQSPVNGVSFQYLERDPAGVLVSCQLAIAMHKMSQLLRELQVSSVMHMGTYNCRTIRNPNIDEATISQHGLGTAIDIGALTQDSGVEYNVLRDWEHGIVSDWQVDESNRFTTDKGRFLYQFARALVVRRIANLVLTPEFNELHHNHFHIDLTPGGYGIANVPGEDRCGH
jgi:hypothetical protein